MKGRLRHQLIIARKYEKPPKIGSIWLNPAWRVDNSRSLWEVIQSSPEADAHLKTDLQPGWILITPKNSGVFIEHEIFTREDGRPDVREIFLLYAPLVLRIIPWTLGGEMPRTLGKRLLVKPDDPTKTSGKILMPDTITPRPVTGEIVDRGPEAAEDLRVGDRILYSLYVGTDLSVNGEKRVLLDSSHALMILDPNERVEAAT